MEKDNNEPDFRKRLYKSRERMIFGVCGGIAKYFNIDPTLVRLITVALSFFGVGCGILIYIIAAIIIPNEPDIFIE